MNSKVALAFLCLLQIVACSSNPRGVPTDSTQSQPARKPEVLVNDTFAGLSPAEHLAKARGLLKANAGEADGLKQGAIETGLHHLDAIPTGSTQAGEASQLRAAFLKQKRQADERVARLRVAEERRLAAEQKRKAAEEAKLEAETQQALRVVFAKRLENQLLDEGFDATVAAAGKNRAVLRIRWILVDRVMAHQMSKESGIFQSAREMGFKRVEITDGYDAAWYWKLD
jgi:hypothetical protein